MPVLKDEQLLQLRPSVLRELCSEQGASAAAARLVRPLVCGCGWFVVMVDVKVVHPAA